jgi:enamine deaminase RidA (YjgF/YER057c/UK114 family)
MSIDRLNPPGLIPPHGHSHVVRVTGGTTLYIAGQSAFGADSQLVGVGDHHAQTTKAFQNVRTALAAAGATWRDVVKATYYVVDVRPETLDAFVRAMNEVLGADADPAPAATFVGVASLAYPDMLVEIDVIAVV